MTKKEISIISLRIVIKCIFNGTVILSNAHVGTLYVCTYLEDFPRNIEQWLKSVRIFTIFILMHVLTSSKRNFVCIHS